jgi:hypothetical protein
MKGEQNAAKPQKESAPAQPKTAPKPKPQAAKPPVKEQGGKLIDRLNLGQWN